MKKEVIENLIASSLLAAVSEVKLDKAIHPERYFFIDEEMLAFQIAARCAEKIKVAAREERLATEDELCDENQWMKLRHHLAAEISHQITGLMN